MIKKNKFILLLLIINFASFHFSSAEFDSQEQSIEEIQEKKVNIEEQEKITLDDSEEKNEVSEENQKNQEGEEKNEKDAENREKDNWGIKGNFKSWGVITSASSPYFKNEDSDYSIFPLIDHPFFVYQGFQKDFQINKYFTITPSLTYSGNYSRDDDALSGIYKELDSTYGSIEAGLKVSFAFYLYSAELGIRQDVNDTYNGNRFYLTAEGVKPLQDNFFQMFNYSLTYNYYSDDFMDYYFGISEQDASDTGLDEYNPQQGSSIVLDASLIKMINQNWTFILSTSIEQLGDDAESEILETQNQVSVGTIFIWTP